MGNLKLYDPQQENKDSKKLFLKIPLELAHDTDLQKGKTLLILGEVISMLSTTGKFYMSNAKLAELYHCDERSIQICLRKLEKKGLIVRVNNYDSKTGRTIGRSILPTPKLKAYTQASQQADSQDDRIDQQGSP